MISSLILDSTQISDAGPFTALVRRAVLGPAFMPGVLVRTDALDEPRSRGFSVSELEPSTAAQGLKPYTEKPGKPG